MKTNPAFLILSALFLVLSTSAKAAPVNSADACIAALNHHDASIVTSDGHGATLHGFDWAMYEEEAPTRAAIVLETTSQVYFYSENSDISATLYACDKETAKVSEFKNGHSLSCDDLPATSASDILYSSCPAN